MGRKLSSKQWMAILMLTIGCMIQKMKHPDMAVSKSPPSDQTPTKTKAVNFDLVMMIALLGSDLLLVLAQVKDFQTMAWMLALSSKILDFPLLECQYPLNLKTWRDIKGTNLMGMFS